MGTPHPSAFSGPGGLRVAAVVEQCWHRVPGGTAVSTVRTLEALAERGDVDVVGVSARHRLGPSPDLAPPVPVKAVPLPRPVLYDAWHYLRRPSLARFTGPVDVVHAVGGVVPPPGPAALVVTVNDLAFRHRPDHFTRRGVRFFNRALDLARTSAEIVLVPSRATAADCAGAGIDPERIRVAPLGATAGAVPAEEVRRIRARYRLPELFVLWAGTAEPRKNLPGLLAAMARTETRAPLVLAGPDGWGMDLGALLAAADCETRRLGPVPARDLAPLYAAARLFVFPSLLEGFGLPVLEAMARGTPVVTSSTTATAEICDDPAALADPADPDALADAIDRVVGDDGEHARRSAAASARARRFTWSATAAAVRAGYRDALS